MPLNFNDAETQSSGGGDFELMPDNTIAPVILAMRGTRKTKAGDANMLDCEFTITEGKFARRKFWGLFMISSNGSSGHDKAVNITKSRVRAMLESARGVTPTDESEAALAARTINDWDDLDGLEFVARIGIEEGTDGYQDKNVLKSAITPDSKDYEGFKPKPVKAATSAPAEEKPAGRPSWG
jgi:hypothetical protein